MVEVEEDVLRVGPNFEFLMNNYEEVARKMSIIQLEGGSRSGKTYAICQFICWYLLNNTGKTVTIARDKMTYLKNTLLLDFKVAMEAFGIDVNIPDVKMQFKFNDNLIRFVGLNDDPMRAHGLKQDVLWVNEVMSVPEFTLNQLRQRTDGFTILDYNPSSTKHYVYKYPNNEDVKFFVTTVFDNPFAPPANIQQIRSYEPTEKNKLLGTADKFMWMVYGLGLRSDAETTIYTEWDYFDEDDNVVDIKNNYDYRFIGLDFGYSQDPAAAVEVLISGRNLYVTPILYETGLLNSDLAKLLKPHLDSKTYVIADSAEPKSIAELNALQIPTIPCVKGPDSINSGINKVKEYKLFINKKGVPLINKRGEPLRNKLVEELENYRRDKVKTGEFAGEILPKPLDRDNHFLDALRYAVTRFNQ